MGKIKFDLADQPKALIGGLTIGISIKLNDPSFFMIRTNSNLTLRITFEEVTYYAHKAKVSQALLDGHRRALTKAPARYPFKYCPVKTQTITKGVLDFTDTNVVMGDLPVRVTAVLVSNKALNGQWDKNALKFGHFNMNFAACYLNGVQYPTKPYTPDFANEIVLRDYHALYESLNQDGYLTYLGITKSLFMNGLTMLSFNFCPDLSEGGAFGHISEPQFGNLRFQLKFAKELEEVVSIIYFFEYNRVLTIDQFGQCEIDYHRWTQPAFGNALQKQ